METAPGKNTYKRTGTLAAILFALMMVLFFVFVYFDSTMPKHHAAAPEPAEHAQAETHAAPADHAAADEHSEHAQPADHGADHSSAKE